MKNDFVDFVNILANVSFESLGDLPMDNAFGLESNNYLDLLWDLKWDFQPEVTSGSGVKMYLDDVVTEFGICYTFNSKMSIYNSYAYWKANRWDLVAHNDTITAHPLDGEIYAQILNMSCSYDVYFHGARETLELSQQMYTFGAKNYATVNLLALEIITSADAKE